MGQMLGKMGCYYSQESQFSHYSFPSKHKLENPGADEVGASFHTTIAQKEPSFSVKNHIRKTKALMQNQPKAKSAQGTNPGTAGCH